MRLSFLVASAFLAAHSCELTQNLGGGTGGGMGTGTTTASSSSSSSSTSSTASGMPHCQLDGDPCMSGESCCSQTCEMGICITPPGSCIDAVKNGAETDVDCGGPSCMACGDGKLCAANTDCLSNNCLMGICQPSGMSGSCIDNLKNGTETDVDCGGPSCMACGDGKLCAINADCFSNGCLMGVCQSGAPPSSCSDLVKNGTETDVDCGGPSCMACVNGKLCATNADCFSNNCLMGTCM